MQPIQRIAEALAFGPTALTDAGIDRYISSQERVLSEPWQHPDNKRQATHYLAAGRLARKLRAELRTGARP